jgi:hypothetical protein
MIEILVKATAEVQLITWSAIGVLGIMLRIAGV